MALAFQNFLGLQKSVQLMNTLAVVNSKYRVIAGAIAGLPYAILAFLLIINSDVSVSGLIENMRLAIRIATFLHIVSCTYFIFLLALRSDMKKSTKVIWSFLFVFGGPLTMAVYLIWWWPSKLTNQKIKN